MNLIKGGSVIHINSQFELLDSITIWQNKFSLINDQTIPISLWHNNLFIFCLINTGNTYLENWTKNVYRVLSSDKNDCYYIYSHTKPVRIELKTTTVDSAAFIVYPRQLYTTIIITYNDSNNSWKPLQSPSWIIQLCYKT